MSADQPVAQPPQFTVGDSIGVREVVLTRADAVRYAGASGDFNPIHYSDFAARDLGLPGVLVHGMWTMGAAASLITEWAGGADRMISFSVRFTKPVFIPDDGVGTVVRFSGAITGITESAVQIGIEASCGDDKVLGAARAEVAL